jgi:hypothetical protein
MALEDFTDPEVAIVAAVAAAVFSPKVRGWLRRGAVYSMAGVLVAGDAISSVAQDIGNSVQRARATAGDTAQNGKNQNTGTERKSADQGNASTESPGEASS